MGESQLEPGFEATEEGFGHMPQPDDGADASSGPDVNEPDDAEAEPVEGAEGQESEAESPPADEENVDETTDDDDSGLQKRINKLTRRFRTLERDSTAELQAARDENAELRRRLAEQEATSEPEKTLADFDFDEKAYRDYLYEDAQKRAQQSLDRRNAGDDVSRETDQEAQPTESELKFAKAEREFSKKHDDYHDVVYDRLLRITPDMRDYIEASDIGPELVYHLGKNPDLAMEIAAQPVIRAGIELSKIEAKLVDAAKKPSKEVSNAPPPPPKDLGGGTAAPSVKTTDPASDKLSDDEWFAKEEARLAKNRG